MLLEEGLNPTLNKYPDYEGEPVDELILFNPSISIQMFGPDSGLTGVELSIQRSDNENDAYWVGYITLSILATIFPDWENREEWLVRTIETFANGDTKKLSFQRDNSTIEAAMAGGFFFLAINGKKIE